MNYITKVPKRSMSDPINNEQSRSYCTLSCHPLSSQQSTRRHLTSMDFVSRENYECNNTGGVGLGVGMDMDMDMRRGISRYRSIPLCSNETTYRKRRSHILSSSCHHRDYDSNQKNTMDFSAGGFRSRLNYDEDSTVVMAKATVKRSVSVGAGADADANVGVGDERQKKKMTTMNAKKVHHPMMNGEENDEEHSSIVILLEYQRLLPKWEGPLSAFGYYWINPKISLVVVKNQIEDILLLMVDNKLVDYSMDENNQCIHGRAFGRHESCTFVVALFNFQPHDNDTDNNNDNGDDHSEITTPNNSCLENRVKPMIEIRRMSGDGFVFEEFFSSFTRQMNQKQILLDRHSSGNNSTGSAGVNVNENRERTSQPMDLDWNLNMGLDMNLTSLDIDISDLSLLTMEPCRNLINDSSEESDDTESTKTLNEKEDEIRDWFNSIVDRNTYGDFVRFCTVQLLEAFESHNRNSHENNDGDEESIDTYLLNIAKTSRRYIVDELLALITSDFYDVFCVRNIVCIVHHILKTPMIQHHYMYQNLNQVRQKIQQVKNQWSDKCAFRVSSNYSIEFDRSQQIVQCCNSCMKTIVTLL